MKEMKTVFKIDDLVKVIDKKVLNNILIENKHYNNRFGYYVGELFVLCSEEVLNYLLRSFNHLLC